MLVGGFAAALHAGHRDSFTHDHVLAGLVDRYQAVLEAVEELPRYKGLDARWHEWEDVVAACRALALRLAGATG